MSRAGRVAGFAIIPLAGIISPLLALPAVTTSFGAGGWASLAVGLAAGAMAATVLEMGWGWNGPMRVARATTRAAKTYLAVALASRAIVLPFVLLAGFLVAWLVAPTHRLEAGLVAVGASLQGLNAAWYFIGRGAPWTAVATDAAPRAGGAAIAAIAIAQFGAPLVMYPIVGLVVPAIFAVLAPLVSQRVTPRLLTRFSAPRLRVVIRSQSQIALARLLSALYMQAPTLVVAGIAPLQTAATFSAGDRLARMGLSGVAPLPNLFQNWVGSVSSRSQRLTRARKAVLWNAVGGLSFGLIFFLAGPFAVEIVFARSVTLAPHDAAIVGVMIAVVCTSRATGGLLLVVSGSQRVLLSSTIAGALTGISLIIPLTLTIGISGAFIAVTASEVVVLGTQIWFAQKSETP